MFLPHEVNPMAGVKRPSCCGSDEVNNPTSRAENDCEACNWQQGCLDEARQKTVDLTGKPSNPKDMVGCNKLPFHLWPETATAEGCLGLLVGLLKCGRINWRVAGVKASIYVGACRRHLAAWFEGEDLDPDSGIPHLGHALACLAIIVDAKAAGNLVDDRQYSGGYRKQIEDLTPHVARLKEKYKDRNPKHWTIQDKR